MLQNKKGNFSSTLHYTLSRCFCTKWGGHNVYHTPCLLAERALPGSPPLEAALAMCVYRWVTCEISVDTWLRTVQLGWAGVMCSAQQRVGNLNVGCAHTAPLVLDKTDSR